MADRPEDLISDEEIRKMLDEESGTIFDWMDAPPFFELNRNDVIEHPDRVWVQGMLDMIRQDGQASGIEQALTMPLRSANLSVRKPEKDRSGRVTEAVEELLFKPHIEGGMVTPFSDVFAQMAMATTIRRTYQELVWAEIDGKLSYRKIAWRPPASCELIRDRRHGDPKGFKQFVDWDAHMRDTTDVDWMGFIEIPSNRAVIHINNQWRDPVFGWSDLEVTKWAWDLKQRVLQLWYTLCGRAAQPWVLAYGKSPSEATNNAKQISRLRSGGVAAVTRPNEPTDKMFDVLDPGAAQAAPLFQALVGYLDGMMSSSVIAGFLDLAGANNNPARASTALSSDHSGLFLQSRRSAAKELENTVNHQIIWPFVRVNFGPKAPVPLLVVEKISMDQVDKAMALLSQLGASQGSNVPPGFIDLLIERVSQYLDLPDDKVRKLIAEHAKQARQQAEAAGAPQTDPESPQGQLEDAVNGALSAVKAPPTGGPVAPSPPEQEAAA